MIVPVHINYRDLEEICYYDEWEKGVVCDDYNAEHEVDVDDVEFDYIDLEEVIDRYLNDVIKILLSDKRYREKLLSVLKNQKNKVAQK
ncbi:hypothetical protein LS215_1851 [Sulfolobus islandicus L.S.2.15]|uniref:Uncharacterized protein n=1 Tax=Saccharolobus islandicus (strain L.S.2.15 / Lassen \|nr:cysteinyl-tRNA synthetase [Sulfolobus islandicus]ACP35847.1 hypothetical protein LS215_1851 [Sulfolobus islandicus L.S.2.15]